LTPKYKNFLERHCSIKERALIVHIVGGLRDSLCFSVGETKDKVRIIQHSLYSALLTRLVQKGVIKRLERGRYRFLDADLVNHIKARCLGRR
tara:strand:+ start:53866 stop:54141 length:276 start_codon:yes stop_codon:yes gene_type:complete